MTASLFLFALAPGWVPAHEEREEIATAMGSVLGVDTTIEWDMVECTVAVEIELGDRHTLEGLSSIVQAFNSGYVHVSAWPGTQTCSPNRVGGFETVPLAVGSVNAVAFGPVAD